jgi:S1-C subfamily serine protease
MRSRGLRWVWGGLACLLTLSAWGQAASAPAAPPRPPATGESTGTSTATGFFVTDAGHLVTAAHAITGRPRILVMLSGRRIVRAEVLKVDEANDLALLKVGAITPWLYLSHSDQVPGGMEVATIGYPQVSMLGVTPKITTGVVSSTNGLRDDPGSFQFSAEVQRGNSGGPLIGPGGTVVGVVRAKLDALRLSQTTNDLAQNVNFATKTSRLLSLLREVPGLPSTRQVDAEMPLRPVRLYAELRNAVVLVVARTAEASPDASAPAGTLDLEPGRSPAPARPPP